MPDKGLLSLGTLDQSGTRVLVLVDVWRLKCFWGPPPFCIYRLKCFAEHFVWRGGRTHWWIESCTLLYMFRLFVKLLCLKIVKLWDLKKPIIWRRRRNLRLWELYNFKNFETMKHFGIWKSLPLEMPEGTLPPWSFKRKIKHNLMKVISSLNVNLWVLLLCQKKTLWSERILERPLACDTINQQACKWSDNSQFHQPTCFNQVRRRTLLRSDLQPWRFTWYQLSEWFAKLTLYQRPALLWPPQHSPPWNAKVDKIISYLLPDLCFGEK